MEQKSNSGDTFNRTELGIDGWTRGRFTLPSIALAAPTLGRFIHHLTQGFTPELTFPSRTPSSKHALTSLRKMRMKEHCSVMKRRSTTLTSSLGTS